MVKKIISEILKFSIKKIIVIGLLLRFILMPVAGHWDLIALNNIASDLVHNGFKSQNFYYSYLANCPPLTYLTLAVWQIIIKPFVGPDFYEWLARPLLEVFYAPHAFRYFFLLKIPYLVFDIGILFLLLEFFKNDTQATRKLAAFLWAFNPVVLYATFSWGAVDIIPAFLLLLAVVLVKKKKPFLGLPFLGIGGAYKLFPLLFIVPSAFVAFSSWKKRILGILIGFLPFLLAVLPFVQHPGFRAHVLESDRQTMLFSASVYIGFLKSIYLFFVFYAFLSLWIEKYGKRKVENLWQYALMMFLFFYATTGFTPQWFVWGVPFFIIHFIKFKTLRLNHLWIFLAYLLAILSFDASLSIGLLSPIEPTFLVMPVFKEFLERFISESTKIWSLFHSLLAGAILWFSYSWWRVKNHEESF